MRSYKVADKLFAFEQNFGSLVETALSALAEDMRNTAESAGPTEFRKTFTESAQRYDTALKAWRELADAITEPET